ncbi:MAG: AAA family ATPase, partial [Pirellulaceae bacterium]|nr:AAA family ATPase [Pirellulaceae bacterium]
MLKALELAGFKSFADKTRFEFPEGITVIVGPNGSGKSNIVDALCFVLGTARSKVMRVKNSAELIFNGGKDGRASDNAEVTVTFDNQDAGFRIDSEAVK